MSQKTNSLVDRHLRSARRTDTSSKMHKQFKRFQALGENLFENAFVKLLGHHVIIKRFEI
jgi:hypothetical protein